MILHRLIHVRRFLLSATFGLTTLTTWAQADAPERLHDGLVKVNLTDFISGKYSLSYERVIGPWTSAELTVTGIGMTTSDYTYSIAPPVTYPWDSFYPSLPADLELVLSGWEVQGAVRKYGWVDDGMPDGFYASVFLTAGSANVEADERIRDVTYDPDTVTFEPSAFLDEIDHTLKVTTWGFGLTVGYQWLTESGLGVDAYFGPMFRGMTRTFSMDGYTDAEAKDIVGNRLQQRYWLRPGPSELYNGTTGPWFNGGVRLSLAF